MIHFVRSFFVFEVRIFMASLSSAALIRCFVLLEFHSHMLYYVHRPIISSQYTALLFFFLAYPFVARDCFIFSIRPRIIKIKLEKRFAVAHVMCTTTLDYTVGSDF